MNYKVGDRIKYIGGPGMDKAARVDVGKTGTVTRVRGDSVVKICLPNGEYIPGMDWSTSSSRIKLLDSQLLLWDDVDESK